MFPLLTHGPLLRKDAVNVWSYVSGQAAVSPRQELPLSVGSPRSLSGALIVGPYKLLIGQMGLSYWQGPSFPNKVRATTALGILKPSSERGLLSRRTRHRLGA